MSHIQGLFASTVKIVRSLRQQAAQGGWPRSFGLRAYFGDATSVWKWNGQAKGMLPRSRRLTPTDVPPGGRERTMAGSVADRDVMQATEPRPAATRSEVARSRHLPTRPPPTGRAQDRSAVQPKFASETSQRSQARSGP